VPSVSRHNTRLGVLAISALLLLGGASGCSTTQEKAEIQQARAKHILATRDDRKKKKREKAREARRNESEQR
jgi:hypothetical protein